MSRSVVCAAIAAVIVVAAAAPRPARSCGPDFEIQYLAQRDATMLELEEGVFTTEAALLVSVPARRYVIAVNEPEGARDRGGAVERWLYALGANAFHAGHGDAAVKVFEALLALPPDLRRHRSTWAAYMLGRLTGRDQWFREVRALVNAGFDDELGLAASGLGLEASHERGRGHLLASVRLYAEQAAHGHPDGATGLLLIARNAIGGSDEPVLLADPLGQRLLGAYLYTRAHELSGGERARLWRMLAAIPGVAGADRLAAVAYRDGAWELAGTLARSAPDATLSRWVRAKLALRDGDRVTAARLLGTVEDGLAAPRCPGDFPGGLGNVERVRTERMILALATDHPVEAMAHAWGGKSSFDAVYVAERVLTIDELRAFVAATAPTPTSEPDEAWAEMSRERLRNLLGRRLMRTGRFAEAPPYLSDGLRPTAAAYTGALADADATADPIARARALYEASRIARASGMELLGTEHSPDWAVVNGQFDLDVGWWNNADEPEADAAAAANDDDAAAAAPRTEPRAAAPSPWTTSAERARVAASAPWTPRRFHYRYTASELAEAAAEATPPRSQAFAALLCHATRYVFNRDRTRVDALWQHYVRDGATVNFAATFGITCPEPEFDRARRYLRPAPSRGLRIALAAVVLSLVWLMWLLWRRRRAILVTP